MSILSSFIVRPSFSASFISSLLKLIWADGGYAGQLIEWVKVTCNRSQTSTLMGIPVNSEDILLYSEYINSILNYKNPFKYLYENDKVLYSTVYSFSYLVVIDTVMTIR
ncbi:MAG TPA: hypothetical protein PL110_20100 [Candidatus Eremiobacteraeota bacterium]|nr:hypothetical protein [Candidatus Eremiobacteraeota bacterium]